MKTLIKIILISIFFTLLSYIFYKIDYSKINSIWDLIKLGFPEAIQSILNNDFLNRIPKAPLFVFWAIVGILAYLLYYSLNLIYNNIWNWAVVKLFFTKAKEVQKFDLLHYTQRVMIHIGIIVSYLIFIILITLIIMPLGSFIYLKANFLNQFASNMDQEIIIKSFFIFILWVIFFSLFVLFFKYIHNKMIEEKITEEHELGIL